MLLQIYESMVKSANENGINLPHYVTLCFYIDKTQSDLFWTGEGYKKEREVLLSEWKSNEAGRYTNVFYGIKFEIRFERIPIN